MKPATALGAMILGSFSSAASANSEKDAVKGVIEAIKGGEDLNVAFPGAITAREVASLRRVSRCSAVNLMKQEGGYYTVVWDCGSRGALGMRVEATGNKITSVSTMEIGMRPNTERR